MHPPTYVCTHTSVHKTIIEDNIFVCNHKQTISQLPRTDHYSNSDVDTTDHGKTIDCITHHVCQEITVGGGEDVVVDVDEEHAGGGGALRR